MSLKIDCQEHFAEVTQFALQNGCLLKLAERLDYLAKYGGGDNICHLHYDWAPHSFAFVMCHSDGMPWFNGGLIYSGPGQPLDGSFPALTVGIGIDASSHSWSVHT
jgi:hypothetical protein